MEKNRMDFTDGWSFYRTELSASYEEAMAAESSFEPVGIPHDWLIYDVKGLYRDGCGWYRKKFRPLPVGGPVLLRFDGVYMDSTVYINGRRMKDWKYGYSTFDVDITDALEDGENEVVVQVRYQAPNSRWYSGAGIYRRVWIKYCDSAWLIPDGTYVSIRPLAQGVPAAIASGPEGEPATIASGPEGEPATIAPCPGGEPAAAPCPEGEPAAIPREPGRAVASFLLEAETETAGRTEGCYLRYSLWDGAVKERELAVLPCGEALRAVVEQPRLWDVESPRCYELLVELCEKPRPGEEVVRDHERMTIGFRTITFDPQKGCFLNGRPLKVHGACEHHDLGCLGAAFHPCAMERKLKLLKDMGVNAIRTSHNMQAPEFMELADRMGFLVVDEAFDMWERTKTAFDYGLFFREWAERDVRSWVRRDRNHPCLLLWSIGNEIYDTHADERGQEITRRLVGYVREHDPKGNAPITIGSNYMAWENARKCADIVKFAGYNYGEKYYEEQHREHPDWIMYGSETASLVQSRGIYHFPLRQPVLAEEDEQCSALGNSTTSWGARSLEKCIMGDRDAEYIFGQFIWSGFDYIGEPTPYHTKNSYFGQLDTAGFPKDSYYVFQAEWTDYREAPMVHLFPYWDFNPGQVIDVRACTNAPLVELFVNGVSRGRQELDHQKGEKLLGDWQVPYEPGTITAVAYDEAGRELARESRSSFGDSSTIRLTADRTEIRADAGELCFLTIETLDAEGRLVENAADYVRVEIGGPGCLMGMDNGDSTDYDQYKSNVRKLFSGRLLAVVGSTGEEGEISVIVTGEGLEPGKILLTARCSGPHPRMEGTGQAGIPAGRETGICQSRPVSQGSAPHPEGLPAESLRPCGNKWNTAGQGERLFQRHPVRKVELYAPDGQCITGEKRELMVEAAVFPAAAEPELIWKVVNESGIELGSASVTQMTEKREAGEDAAREHSMSGSRHRALVTAYGDGEFYVRCMARDRGRITVISQLEFKAEGLGQAFLNPYELVSAGLYTDTLGEIGNGNEKGIATARDGVSGVVYSGLDFGEFGSDEITLPVFALSDEKYPIEIWLGRPQEAGSCLLDTVIYQKPSRWNVYQEETYRLPERIRGIATLGFLMRAKVHLKGFWFTRQEKAYAELWAAEADSVYGDSFRRDGRAVREIGNNVTLVYGGMDFGEEGAGSVTIWGRTPLEKNSIHVHFTDESGETENRILEFAGEGGGEHRQTFAIERLTGRGRVEIIFLPGSSFDLVSVLFHNSLTERDDSVS